jgi:hypothetical protein
VLLRASRSLERVSSRPRRHLGSWLAGVAGGGIFGVIPFRAKERVHQYHGFAILGDPEIDDEVIVLAETVTRAITVRASGEVAEYVEHVNGLRAAAIDGERRKTLLQELAEPGSNPA